MAGAGRSRERARRSPRSAPKRCATAMSASSGRPVPTRAVSECSPMNAPAAVTLNPRSSSRSAASSSASSKARLPYSPTTTAGVPRPSRCANSSRSSTGTRPAYTGNPNTSTSSAAHETSAGRCAGSVRLTASTEASNGAANAPATSCTMVLVVRVGLKYTARTIDDMAIPLFSRNPSMIPLFAPARREPDGERARRGGMPGSADREGRGRGGMPRSLNGRC